MKKQIMSKRGRRFDEGGEVQNIPRARTAEEDQESADKAAGLAASNKDKSMGFFERLRAGNIDDPTSEAYKRFGAGRGRSERVPVADVMPTPVERAKPVESFPAEPTKASMEESKDTSNYSNEGRSRPEYTERKPQPSKIMSAKPKPAKKEYDPTAGEAQDKAAQAAADEQGNRPKAKVESIMKKKPVATAATFDAFNLNNFAEAKTKEEKPKSTYKKNATSSPSGRKAGTSKSIKENDVDFAGYGLGMKRGGSVSKASSRADGIAQRGKTRGKMC